MGVAAAILGGAVASGAINALSTAYTNKQNIRAQKDINKQQLDYSKNAYTYAAADRLRSGLSPIDTQPSQVPNLSAPQSHAPQVPDFGEAISSAYNAKIADRQTTATENVSNAEVAKKQAETAAIDLENSKKVQTLQDEVGLIREQLRNSKTLNDYQIKELESKLREREAVIANYESEKKQRDELTPSLKELNVSQSALNAAQMSESVHRLNEAQSNYAHALSLGFSSSAEYQRRQASRFGSLDIAARELWQYQMRNFKSFVDGIKSNLAASERRAFEKKYKDDEYRAQLYEVWQKDKAYFDRWYIDRD